MWPSKRYNIQLNKLDKLIFCSLNIICFFTVVEEVLRIGVETRRPAFMDVTLGADQRQILPPRPELPTKPTCSFIRPVIKEVKPKNLKQDPVKLHQFYKEHWEKTRLPGKSQ